MRTIFLTGGTGFIGRQLVEELLKEEVMIFLLVRSKSKATRVFQKKVFSTRQPCTLLKVI